MSNECKRYGLDHYSVIDTREVKRMLIKAFMAGAIATISAKDKVTLESRGDKLAESLIKKLIN